jgi:hypothetical protein
MGDGSIWGYGDCDGFNIILPDIGRCDRVEEIVEVPEMVPTGHMIKETRTRYVCQESEE